MTKKKSRLPIKTTSYYVDESDGLALSKRGSLWSIGVETADGVIEFELSTEAACWVRQFMEDAVCAECSGDRSWLAEEDVQYPTTIREAIDAEQARKIDVPVVDLMAALKASVEAAKNRPEAVSRASIEPDPVTEAENGATD